MNKRLNGLSRSLGLPSAPPPFQVDTKVICRRVHDTLVTGEKERKAYMKQRIKIGLVLVAAVLALTGTAVAVGPTMWTMLTKALGSFAPYAQVIEGASVTDQGLRITVEAAMSDKSLSPDAQTSDKVQSVMADRTQTIIYVSVTDLKGDRLDESTELGGYECVSYDPESRTALFKIDYSRAFDKDGTITLKFDLVRPGCVEQTVGFPQELLKDRTLTTQILTGKEIERSRRNQKPEDRDAVVLMPGQTPMPLAGTDLLSVSSAGFDQSGIFHILYEAAEGVSIDSAPLFQTCFFDDRDRARGYTNDRIWFGGGKYLDVSYVTFKDELNYTPALITKENISHLTFDDPQLNLHTKPDINGQWNLTFAVDTLPVRTIMVNQPLGGLMVKYVSLTAISATAVVEPIPGEKVHYSIPGLQLTLYLKDGSYIIVDNNYAWTFGKAVDLETVTAIAIGQWYMPLEGDAAQPGCWLAELPK